MRVCVYQEYENFARKFGDTGIGNATKMQRIALEMNGIEVTTKPNEEYDIIDINPMGFFEALSVASKARKSGKIVVVHAHTTPENFRNSFWFSDILGPLIDRQMVKLYNMADLVICVEESMKDSLKRMGVKKPMAVVGNAVDVEKFEKGNRREYREKYGMKDIVAFCTGIVLPRKGIDTFVEVGRIMPETQFFWFGPKGRGILFSHTARKIIARASPNVKFTGYVDNIASAYAAGDILFFPTYNENFSVTFLEALSAGKPSIVRDIPAFSFVQEWKECLKARTTAEFVEKLNMLIEDAELRKRIGRHGKKKVREFAPKRIGAKLKSIYEKLG